MINYQHHRKIIMKSKKNYFLVLRSRRIVFERKQHKRAKITRIIFPIIINHFFHRPINSNKCTTIPPFNPLIMLQGFLKLDREY